MRNNSVENRYIQDLDRPSDDEITRRSLLSEELVTNSMNAMAGFRAELSSASEDSGKHDIGQRQTIDMVLYFEDRPVMGVQITTAQDAKTQRRKLQELAEHPFIRLAKMKPQDTAIPRALVHIPREMVESYSKNLKLATEADATLKIINDCLISLNFILTQTKNPLEQKAIQQLLGQLTGHQKKLLH